MIWKALPALGLAVVAAAPACPRPAGVQQTGPEPPREAAAETNEAASAPGSSRVRGAIERALAVLQADGDAWMEGSVPFQSGNGCVSCHQVPYGVWGLHEAARSGVALDAAAAQDLTRRAVAFSDNRRTGRPMSWSPMMLGLGEAQAAEVDSYVGHLLAAQRPPGFWEAKGQFPSQRRELSETNAVATMLAMLALAPAAAEDDEVAESLEVAWGWLLERGPGASTEWLALRAAVAAVRGETAEAGRLLDRLSGQQNEDGGWGWQPGEPSNAMSTGEALWTLGLAAVPAQRAAVASRGLDYLLAAQGDDGWWRLPSRLVSGDANEGNDYVYAYWGTAWATIGLARWQRAVQTAEPESGPTPG